MFPNGKQRTPPSEASVHARVDEFSIEIAGAYEDVAARWRALDVAALQSALSRAMGH